MKTATRRRSADHVVLIDGGAFLCSHCGEKYRPAYPAPIDVLAATSKAFAKTHARCVKRWEPPATTTPEEWLRGYDTGISSKTIWSVMTGMPVDRRGIPYDPSDFGRCFRLLKLFPAWRARLDEMRREPGWAPLVDAWSELEALYLEEVPTGRGVAPKLYARMSELVDGRGSLR